MSGRLFRKKAAGMETVGFAREEGGTSVVCGISIGGATMGASALAEFDNGKSPLMLGSFVTAQFISLRGRILSSPSFAQSDDRHTGLMKRYRPPSRLLRPRSLHRTCAHRPVGRFCSPMIQPAATVGLSWSRLWWSKSTRTPGQFGAAANSVKALMISSTDSSSMICVKPVGLWGHSPKAAMWNQPSSGRMNGDGSITFLRQFASVGVQAFPG